MCVCVCSFHACVMVLRAYWRIANVLVFLAHGPFPNCCFPRDGSFYLIILERLAFRHLPV